MGTALTFGAATTDRVEWGTTPADADPFSVFAWVYPTTLTTSRGIFGSRSPSSAAASVRQLRLSGTGGNIELRVSRATTATSYISSNTPLATLNKWYCVLATFDSTASPTGKLYVGDLVTAMAEVTYGTSTAGSGAVTAEASQAHTWGNRFNSTPYAHAFQGSIACGQYHNRVLSLGEGLNLQWHPRMIAGVTAFHLLGRNGTGTQPDLSGNARNGTVTGATASNGPPLGWPFFRSAAEASSVIAAAPAGVTYPQLERYLRGLNRGLAMGSH